MSQELANDLEKLAQAHGLSFSQVIQKCADIVDYENLLEDVSSVFEEECVKRDFELMERVAKTAQNRWDCEYGTWDNIRNAMAWEGISYDTYPDDENPNED
ncbi:MAG: hypothetical protein K2K81_10285 [Muribaculaceae bacterium]|nr:hypothetical protein [Muribaculaceae bacterium]